MTQIVAPPVPAHPAMPFSVGLPDLKDSVIVRPRLEQQLRAVECSPLTVVEARWGRGRHWVSPAGRPGRQPSTVSSGSTPAGVVLAWGPTIGSSSGTASGPA